MKKLLIVIGLLLASLPSFAQIESLLKPVDDLVFANFDRNQLLYPGDSLAMERFFSKMDSVLFLGKATSVSCTSVARMCKLAYSPSSFATTYSASLPT